MRSKLLKKLVSSVVIACLLFSSFGVAFGASASVTSDIKGHWAEAQLSAWMDKGIIKGYEDGSFKPENKITRAEFIALINRSFGFTEEAAISFSDVQVGNWAYPEIAKAVKAGYITGYTDGTIGVSKPISRQEVAAIVDRLLELSNTDRAATAYTDSATIALWAKDSVEAIVAEKIMSGYAEDNSFKPAKSITRAEAVVTLDRAIAAQSVVYDKAGTYGPATGVETINSNIVVLVAGVTLQNMVINGDLLLGEGIGSGDAFLNNVKVTGTVTVQGGGENSIHFNNSVLIDIIIDKKSGTGMVRIVSEGTTTVALVVVNSPANIQENNSTGAGFGNVNLSAALPTGSTVTLAGSFNTVNVSAKQIIVEVPEGTIENVNANSTATGMSLNLSQGATINSLLLNAVVEMLGQGTIVAAVVNIPGTTFQTPPQSGTTPPPVVITPPSSGDTPSTPNVVIVRGITVTGAGNVITVVDGATLQMSAAVVPANATNQTIAWTVASGTGTATITTTGLLTATGVGSVTVTATNAASGVTGTKVITVTAEPMVAAYMDAADVEAVVDLLDANVLGLTLTDYAELDATGKTEVATALYTARATFTTEALIQSAVTAAIASAKTALDTRVADEAITAAKAALVADTIRNENSTLTIVTTDMDLVTTGENGTTIEWSSESDAVDTITGVITRPNYDDGNNTFSLIATITKGNGTPQTKQFEVTVLKDTFPRDTRLIALNLTGVTLNPIFHPDTRSYTVTVPYGVTETTTISATTMNPDARIDSVELGEKQLAFGTNVFEITVFMADNFYYEDYIIEIYRQTEEETAEILAREAAIAAIEAYDGEDLNLIELLNTASDGNEAIEANLEFYIIAILAAADGALDTRDEISSMISDLNYSIYQAAIAAAITKIEAVTVSADSISVDDLNKAIDGGMALEENLQAYKSAIISAEDGALDSAEEIYTMINQVNSIVTIERIDLNSDIFYKIILIQLLNAATGPNTAIEANKEAYWEVVINAEVGALDTSEEISAMISDVHGIVLAEQMSVVARIEENDGLISITDLNKATGVNTAYTGNLTHYRDAIVAAVNGALDTPGKIATMVQSVNFQFGGA